ncbi:MAG TPA: chemotaxis protein CheB, partial [Gaiellaceae bacterium]|nr:chemotaxis protein CheB [Gaiellaceae bacterium]
GGDPLQPVRGWLRGARPEREALQKDQLMYDLVCIGASWGGLRAIGQVLADLPAELDLPIAIAQHRHPDSQEGTLAELLQAQTNRPVLDVEDKMAIEPSHVYIAPPNYHLLVERGSFALSVDERVQYSRPSIDVMFESAAYAYGPGAIGIILTGANEDGAAGLALVKQRGGVAVIQDPAGAARRTMPEAAIAATAADAILPLEEIGKFVYGLCVKAEA